MSAIESFQLRFWRLRRGSQSLLSRASRYWGASQPISVTHLFPILDRLFMDIDANRSDGYEHEMLFGLLQIMLEVNGSLGPAIIRRYFPYLVHIETDLQAILIGESQRVELHDYYVQIAILQKQFYTSLAPISQESLRDLPVPRQEVSIVKLANENAKRWASMISLQSANAVNQVERERALLAVFMRIEFSMKSWFDALFYIFEDAQFRMIAYGGDVNQREFLALCLIMERMITRRPEFIEFVWSQYGNLLLNYFRDDSVRLKVGDHPSIISLLSKLAVYAIQTSVSPENVVATSSFWLQKQMTVTYRSSKWTLMMLPAALLALLPVLFVISDTVGMPTQVKIAICLYSVFVLFASWSGCRILENCSELIAVTNERRIRDIRQRIHQDIYRLSVKLQSHSQ